MNNLQIARTTMVSNPAVLKKTFLCILVVFCACVVSAGKYGKYPYLGIETSGVRPYEMDWAGRYEDDCPALVDFEDSAEWIVSTKGAVASFELSQEQPLFGKYVGKLTYRATGEDEHPQVDLRLAVPRPVPSDFNLLGCWIFGNAWSWEMGAVYPWVTIQALFILEDGSEYVFELSTGNVRWKYWFLSLKYLSDEELAILNAPNVKFAGFRVDGDPNTEDSAIYFDSLTFRKDEFRPLEFQPRPRRGIEMFPGQSAGANNGPGRLPFPTREETILPDSAAIGSAVRLDRQEDGAFEWVYEGADGTLSVQYKPASGRWDDVRMRWQNGDWFQPLCGGGLCFPAEKESVQAPERAELLNVEEKGRQVVTTWRFYLGAESFEGTYAMELRGKTLIVDTKSLGGKAGGVQVGGAKGLRNPRAFLIPYYDYATSGRPGCIVSDGADGALFYSAHIDWYRSNSSLPTAKCTVDEEGLAHSNGGTIYLPKTDGVRNDCFERFFVTVSPRFEETLPVIPNPPSPWKHVTGTHQMFQYTASNLETDKMYWRNIWRHGIRKLVVEAHETNWRDGGESFTFRTKAAPAKGGDEGFRDYADFMQNTLGYFFGPYNNFTDFAPVNEFWDIDKVTRRSDGQLQTAWARCYAPKPQYGVEFCERLTPIIQDKFHFSTGYCDVHTAVTPWLRCDFDHRVPGGGTFAATFYAFGEIMLIQKRCWNGPVYSEGPHFCFYSGLTDGNFANDDDYFMPQEPWLVDFDLRKIHPLECNVGMGHLTQFYHGKNDFIKNLGMEKATDLYHAATVAFGHPGLLGDGKSMRNTLKGYFMLLPLHGRYTQADVDFIGYVDDKGNIFETSQAIATDTFRRSQVVVRYKDGTCVAANGNLDEPMKCVFQKREIELPPAGYTGWTEDGEIFVQSALKDGARCDYAVTPDSIYIDGRDRRFQRFPMAGGRGCGICRKEDETHWEFIPWRNADCGWNLPVLKAVALDREGKEMGTADVRSSRGLHYVVPVEGAFSYLLEIGGKTDRSTELTCSKDTVAPGESVVVTGAEEHVLSIPSEAKAGERLWYEIEGAWIDFTVEMPQE